MKVNREQVDLLGEYIKSGKSIILIEQIPQNVIEKGAVIIESDCSNSELFGYYDNLEYITPKWYRDLCKSDKEHIPVLVIKDINKIPEKEQRKFIELFKYKKIYIHKIPENCMIFVTYSDLEKQSIEEEVYSFMAHI